MTESATSSAAVYSPVLHRIAVLLTIAVFPLIWVGGLVTTYDAGMAVPDWPGTYGWNMFAYPISTWVFGPFDLLVEHSHRLLGALSGFLSIGLVWAAFRNESRAWFRWWSVFILVAVIAQGALGGARVLMDERTFAMIHGCTGPLFFALATATAVMSSRWWIEGLGGVAKGGGGVVGQNATGRLAVGLATSVLATSYLQLVVGSQLRHVTGMVSHRAFKVFVHTHLGLAGVLFLLVLGLALYSWFGRHISPRIRFVSQILGLCVLLQIALGIGTWIVNYALPWPETNAFLAAYTITSKGYWESLIVNSHVAMGSLIISLATVATFRAWRSYGSQ